MGSSSSKVKLAGEAELQKIRPFLHRRYEELKKRKQRIVTAIKRESTHSNKNQDEDATCDCNSLEPEAMVTPPRKTEPAKVVPLPYSDCQTEELIQIQEKEKNDDDDGDEKYYDYEEEEVEEEKEKEKEVEFGMHMFSASPSFRIYCIPELNPKEESGKSEESKIQERDTCQKPMNEHETVESLSPSSGHIKTQSVESFQSAAPSENSKASTECLRTDSSRNKRGHTRKKLRAVRNLLHVKSCVGGDKTQIVVAKATE